MFDHHSGSGASSTLWILTAFAIGVSLFPVQCNTAAAQQTDLSLGYSHTILDASVGLAARTAPDDDPAHPGDHGSWLEELKSKTWPGFFTGLPGYDDFVMPIGMPMYFEDPFITSDVRLLYMHHQIPGSSVLGSGQVHVAAAQIRLALTERLAFIVTKGGYSWVDSHTTPDGDAWRSIPS